MSDVAHQLASTQLGVVTTAQLARRGLTRAAIRHLIQSGQWERVGRRAIVRVGAPSTQHQRLLIAVLDVDPSGAISHSSAAWLWGLSGFRPEPTHVATQRTNASASIAGIETRRVRALPDDWTTRHLGVPVVRPELLALHLFGHYPRRAERCTDRLWADGLLSGRSIASILSQLGERGRNGTAGLREYLDRRGFDYTPPATSLEFRLNEIVQALGVEFQRQVDLGGDGWCGRVDFVCIARSLVLEAQSERFHASLTDRRADAQRRSRLEAASFTVLEVWDSDIFHRPWVVTDQLRAALASAP